MKNISHAGEFHIFQSLMEGVREVKYIIDKEV